MQNQLQSIQEKNSCVWRIFDGETEMSLLRYSGGRERNPWVREPLYQKFNRKIGLYEIIEAFPKECRAFISEMKPALAEWKEAYKQIDYYADPCAKMIALAALKAFYGQEHMKKLNSVIQMMAMMDNKKGNKNFSMDIEMCKSYPIENLYTFKKKRKHSQGFMASCPFGTHDDNTPSFGVKDNKFICFSCGAKGTVIDFVMLTQSMSFSDAVKYIRNLQHGIANKCS